MSCDLLVGDSVMCKVKAAGASYVQVVTTDQQAPNAKDGDVVWLFLSGEMVPSLENIQLQVRNINKKGCFTLSPNQALQDELC